MILQNSEKSLILLVDDVPANLHLLTAALRAEYRIKAVTSGKAALELAALSEDKPELILLDMMMPDMNGIEVLRRLRQNKQTREIPVIFISADSSEQSQLDSLEMGADDYLTKPIVQTVLQVRVRNLLQRKQTEELLRKSAEEIEDLYNHAPCGYHSLDKDGFIVKINDTELQWLGYTREEVVGKIKLPDLLTPESILAFHAHFALFKEQGHLNDCENEFIRKDGTTFYGLVNASVIYDAKGDYLMSRSTVFDITERKKVEDKLRTLSTAIEQGPTCVVVTDLNANIEYVNPKFSDITGYSADEVMGKNPRLLQSGKTTRQTYREMWDAITQGQVWRGELLNKSKNGKLYWEETHIAPVKNSQGINTHYVAVKVDITERKEIEERIRYMANYDVLTDLPNRSMVADRLRQAFAIAKREKRCIALMFLDLDKFKPINDTLGHDVGDGVLKEAARRMQACMRESDTVGRVGGDEFIVLLPRVETAQDAMGVAEKIRWTLNQTFVLAGHHLNLSSSIGVALYPEHGDDEAALIKNADIAMYHAKNGGSNNARLFESSMLEA